MVKPKTLLLIALACSLIQVSISEYNISLTGVNQLIQTADSPSYVNPPKNFLASGVWKDSFEGTSSYVQRPPLYGSLYFISSIVSNSPLSILKIIQYALMFVGIFFFGRLINLFSKNKTMTILATSGFGLFPFFHGFVGYVMTEAVASYLLLIFTFSFLDLYKNRKGIILFTITGALVLVLRTQLIIFPLLYVVVLLFKHRVFATWTLLLFLPFFMWQLRVKNVMGSFQLHPIYSYSNKSIFRPPHEELTNLFRVWEHDSERFHQTESILRKDTTEATLRQAIENVPKNIRNTVRRKLKLYQDVSFKQSQMWKKGENRKLGIEELFVSEIVKWEKTQKKHFALSNWMYTPAKSFEELIKSSHLNHYIFQKTYRGNFFIEFLRIISVLFILASLISSAALLMAQRISMSYKIVITSVLLSILYLVFIQRMNETRYMAPYLPLLFTGLCLICNHLFYKQKKPIA